MNWRKCVTCWTSCSQSQKVKSNLWRSLSSPSDMATWYQRPSWGRSSAPSALWAACWSSPCQFPSLSPTSAGSTTRAREPRRDEHRRWRPQTLCLNHKLPVKTQISSNQQSCSVCNISSERGFKNKLRKRLFKCLCMECVWQFTDLHSCTVQHVLRQSTKD